MTREARALSVRINRPAAEAYEFLVRAENFSKWASWIAETPQGLANLRLTERNSYGVLDHAVRLPRGTSVYVPLRLVPKGEGCELMLTLFRRPDMSDEQFAVDAERVTRDLLAAKRILEASGGPDETVDR